MTICRSEQLHVEFAPYRLQPSRLLPLKNLRPGYWMRIIDTETGEQLLSTSVNPITGYKLASAAECLEITSWYITPEKRIAAEELAL